MNLRVNQLNTGELMVDGEIGSAKNDGQLNCWFMLNWWLGFMVLCS